MKTLIILAVVAFGGIFTNNDVMLRTSTERRNNPKAAVKTKIVFGRKSLDCAKLGFCTVVVDAGPIEIDLSAVEPGPAKATVNKSGDNVVINFVKSSMTSADYSKRFANNKFVVEENYTLTLENTLISSYVIKKGTYDVTENGKFLTVQF